MLLKSLEFKRSDGQQVKVTEIPLLKEDDPHFFMAKLRLEAYLEELYDSRRTKSVYSFREYLKRALKWRDYLAIYQQEELKHNA
ncbi:hypothetical protein ACH95_05430 [Bacillus glycinifermentans]|uniref:YpmP family protein n=1 Tax=Bacillus glycinifermentans TaxID=1664069 RepID=A0A0J6EPP1_9BACI|nr:YpmP family protein [Bacillus glycinifermentans]ATH92083.1 DUF2535 domain-containing protein [Bacillus glycinifermentans]KMM62461.1 hypothetical protein ACH95_05430 [Bacillus glycinifermentans]KRT93041.1 hypothetical protein AB447_221195 [Bacillus glycinifermentans]MEC0486681.1 YpmP family protein [Bacillus glycinifermentans]MEC0494755.1 YpmP family protein [Bacillus glycinifermentans]